MGCGVVERHLEMAEPTKTNKKQLILVTLRMWGIFFTYCVEAFVTMDQLGLRLYSQFPHHIRAKTKNITPHVVKLIY